MTQDRFLQLMANPELLSGITLEELRTLVLAYPYASNLRYLLAIKAAQVQHPEEARFIQAAATYSLNRKCLFLAIMPMKLTPVALATVEKEPVLELKPIETVQKELLARVPFGMKSEVAEKVVARELEIPKVAPEPDIRMDMPETMEKQSFRAWFVQFHPPVLSREPQADPAPETAPALEPTPEPMPPARKKAEKVQALSGIAQSLAEKSVSENEGIMSETLAKLLAQQGYRDKAIHMYQRLSLVFPEKSDYFAAQIEKLKK